MATANSRIVKVVISNPDLENDAVFCDTLIDFAKKQPLPLLLIPCGDNYAQLLVKHQTLLRPYYHFACMSSEVFEKIHLKENFYALCDRYGFSYPKTTTCHFSSFSSFTPPFGFPIIIKPSNSVAYWNCKFPHKKKVFVAKDKEEMQNILQAIYSSSYKDHLIIQEYIPGDDSYMRVLNCYSGLDQKVKLAALGHPLLEEHTPEGIGSYASIINTVDLPFTQKMIGFLNDLGYIGFSNFDMKIDPRDHSYKFFEMNPRQGRSSYFVTAAGYNLAEWITKDVMAQETLPLTIAENKALYTLIPNRLLMKYLQNAQLKEEAKALIKEKKVCHALKYKKDSNIKRRMAYAVNQYRYYQKYKKYFGKKGYEE